MILRESKRCYWNRQWKIRVANPDCFSIAAGRNCLKAVDSMGSNRTEPTLDRPLPSFSNSLPPAMDALGNCDKSGRDRGTCSVADGRPSGMRVSHLQLSVDWTMVVGAMQPVLTGLTECRSRQAPKAGDLLVGAQSPTYCIFSRR
jgi:hypothetical protein